MDPSRVGYPVQAFLALSTGGRRQSMQATQLAGQNSCVLEEHHIAGTNDHPLKVVSTDIAGLEPLIDVLNDYGKPATSFVLSSPKPWSPIIAPPTTGT